MAFLEKQSGVLAMTYQHVLSAFVSAGVTVEMLSKAWFYMSTFVLQHRKVK